MEAVASDPGGASGAPARPVPPYLTQRRTQRSAAERDNVVHRPSSFGLFEFAVLSGLRAAQLMRGCTPRLESTQKVITIAQLEVAAGKIAAVPLATSPAPER
jgi:DNA-directed RNA polymerase subunit K/omega